MSKLKIGLILLNLVFAQLAMTKGRRKPDKGTNLKYSNFREVVEGEKLVAPNKNYVFMIIHPSRTVISYRNETEFQKTILVANGLLKKDINSVGHAQVGWYCNTNRGVVSGAAGYTGETSGQFKEMVGQGWGMTPLFATFLDGYVEEEWMVLEDLHDGHNEGQKPNYNWVAFEVSEAECMQGVRFWDEFTQRSMVYPPINPGEELPYGAFGFMVDPNSFEGAGCTSFATAFMSKTDTLLNRLSSNWNRSIPLPKRILGNPGAKLREDVQFERSVLRPIPRGHVSREKILMGHWGSEVSMQNAVELEMLDPELIAYQFRELERAYFGGKSKMQPRKIATFKAQSRIKKLGQRRAEKLSFRNVKIDQRTDKYFNRVYQGTKRLKAANPKLKVYQRRLMGQPGLIIRKN